MFNGARLTDDAKTVIYLAACELVRSGKKNIRFKDDSCEGVINTEHKRKFVASGMTGIEFSATVEHEDGKTKCRFLVNDIKIPSEEEFRENYRWFTIRLDPQGEADEADPADWWKSN